MDEQMKRGQAKRIDKIYAFFEVDELDILVF